MCTKALEGPCGDASCFTTQVTRTLSRHGNVQQAFASNRMETSVYCSVPLFRFSGLEPC